MQDDRYNVNKFLYLTGMISLILAMALFMFAGYIFTYLFFGFIYNVPEFIIAMQDYIGDNWALTSFNVNLFIFCVFFIPSIFLGWLSYWASNRIDNELLALIDNIHKTNLRSIKSDFTIHLVKFLTAIIGFIVVFMIIRWLIIM